MKSSSRHFRRLCFQCVLSGLLIGLAQTVSAVPLVNTYQNPAWADADKLHLLSDPGTWGINYWDDTNGNNVWDKVEPLADSSMPGWTNPKWAKDESCWIASASNMLASEGFGTGNAQDIYWDMIYNMVLPWNTDLLGNPAGGWQFGGWQHEALNWYLSNRPRPQGSNYAVSYYGVYNGEDKTTALAWPNNPFDFAADLLSSDHGLGIVIHSRTIYHAITFQGYDDTLGSIKITDSDRNENSLATYAYNRTGATQWYLTDYTSGGIAVDYFATLRQIPIPGSLWLLPIGLTALIVSKSGFQGMKPRVHQS